MSDVLNWLLDSDPAIRWQVLRDLTDSTSDEVSAERARVAREGWGAQLLSLQDESGHWGGEEYSQDWTTTTHTLVFLRLLGIDPRADEVRTAIGKVRNRVVWSEWGRRPFFTGEVETCINGMVLALAAYFDQIPASDGLLQKLLTEQLEDGGWNCLAPAESTRSSFHTTMTLLEALLEYEQSVGAHPVVTAARRRGEEYLLDRRLMRRLSTGQIINPNWLQCHFPPRWRYDVLRALDYLQASGRPPDERCREAVDLLVQKRRPDGRWPLDSRYDGAVYFHVDGEPGEPSRWNTLRALRVLRWFNPALEPAVAR
ncbi:MAG: hypothetical protein IT290_02825 [Deltaproteobacteria bacterium]|nr:hypothetical protein [Deltaproteobacteria bacterium]